VSAFARLGSGHKSEKDRKTGLDRALARPYRVITMINRFDGMLRVTTTNPDGTVSEYETSCLLFVWVEMADPFQDQDALDRACMEDQRVNVNFDYGAGRDPNF
jgi:hypothetical protein